MIVGFIKESFPGERRVAVVPGVISALAKAGCELLMESGAGAEAGFPDALFTDKGVSVVSEPREVIERCDVLLQVRSLGANPEHGERELEHMRRGQVVIGLFEPLTSVEACKSVADKGVTLLAMELVPRITRAQSMDVLSSMATIGGYKAALLAANHLPKMFPMMMTAAGTITPAKVFVIGAGVAGLQSIASCRRLGAQVEAYDLRPAVKEQVQSLGARFVEMELDAADAEGSGGYAKAMDEDFYRRQRELMTRVIAEVDVVITTAAVPGKKAPLLITEQMVQGMRSGSVIVDLAAERGGNCELTRAGEVVHKHGVQILGPMNLAAEVPYHASQMYAKNITTLLLLMLEDGKLKLDMEDEIIRETMVTHDGKITSQKVLDVMGTAQTAT